MLGDSLVLLCPEGSPRLRSFIEQVSKHQTAPIDADEIWEWLAGDNLHLQHQAQLQCQNFLEHYVRNSNRERLVWGPEESREERGITTVTAVNTKWKCLIAAAQEYVLNPLARKTGRRLTVARLQGPKGAADTGPGATVTKVSANPLPPPILSFNQ